MTARLDDRKDRSESLAAIWAETFIGSFGGAIGARSSPNCLRAFVTSTSPIWEISEVDLEPQTQEAPGQTQCECIGE